MDCLEAAHHVLTYVGGSKLDNGVPLEGAFMKTDWSSSWLEHFDPPKSMQVDKARDEMSRNINLGSTGCLAELNVGDSCRRVKESTGQTIFYERVPKEGYLSHCETRGMPSPSETERQFEVAAALAESVLETYPTTTALQSTLASTPGD